MGEPLSPDRVFDFPVDEPELHPSYDFFTPGPLPGYAGNPNNDNGWIEADVPLLGELGAVADEPMVGPLDNEIAELMVEAEEQVIAPVVGMDEDIAMLFGDNNFDDDDSEGFDKEAVWEVNEEWLMAPITPPLMPAVQPPGVYEVGGNLEYRHRQLVKKVIQVSDAEVAAGNSIREIGPRASIQQRDSQIQQLQTTVSEMSSRESTLIQCILGMDKRLTDLERRPPRPQ
ncbi:hypothetical protein Tco_0671699 [Tanacetum coccineum]